MDELGNNKIEGLEEIIKLDGLEVIVKKDGLEVIIKQFGLEVIIRIRINDKIGWIRSDNKI